jgi:hypothetical protein
MSDFLIHQPKEQSDLRYSENLFAIFCKAACGGWWKEKYYGVSFQEKRISL